LSSVKHETKCSISFDTLGRAWAKQGRLNQ